MPKKFCKHHGKSIEWEPGYKVLTCAKRHKVCAFKVKDAVEFCPEVELLPYEFAVTEEKECEGDKCEL